MAVEYTYNEEQASKADSMADRIDTGGAYVGTFLRAEAVESEKGTQGVLFEFEAGSAGKAEFTLWTVKDNGEAAFGMNFLQSILLMFGLRGLKAVSGLVERYDYDAGKRIEEEGEVFPDLVGKKIGVILQKELTTRQSGGEGFRMNCYGIFHHETRLTASEIRERKVTPAKVDKLLRSLKDKDSRKAKAEPAQPSMAVASAPEGTY